MGTWTVPPGPQGVLCHPPLPEWAAWAASNRAAAADWTFDVQGVPAPELRAAVGRRLRALARLGEDAQEGPLFVTGHQPEFYHPGVWLKAFAATEAARRSGGAGVNLVVDHDTGDLAATLPRRVGGDGPGAGAGGGPGNGLGLPKGELQLRVHRLAGGQGGRPFERMPPPTPVETAAFVEAVDRDVATLDVVGARERWRTFADGLLALVGQDVASAAEVGWRSRAKYERALGGRLVPDVPLSSVCETPEFLRFVLHWIVHAAPFRKAYNDALALFRERRKIRSRANPFPDLLVRPHQGIELPFWALTPQGIRRKLYVRSAGDRLILSHLEGDVATLPAAGGDEGVAALQAAGVPIRPRAVPLTVFIRLFAADVFVHGTGGARYDEVTDGFIAQAFGVAPPAFAVVSATVHLPLRDGVVQPSALQGLQRKLRDLRFNPQRHAWETAGQDAHMDARLAVLLREKERLIGEINKVEGPPYRSLSPGEPVPATKRVLTRAIEKTNAALYELLADVERATREQLVLWQRRARSGAIATGRTYPFFLFDPKEMMALLRNGGN